MTGFTEFCFRDGASFRLKRPHASIHDCAAGLALKSDSAKVSEAVFNFLTTCLQRTIVTQLRDSVVTDETWLGGRA